MSLLEKIASYIPGYGGYKAKEIRRETDAKLRRHIAFILSEALGSLWLSPTDARAIDPDARFLWESVRASLERAIQRIDKAPHGYAGFFNIVKVDESILDSVYKHDLSLLEIAEEISRHAASVKSKKAGSSEWIEALRLLQSAVERLNSEINQRQRILSGVK